MIAALLLLQAAAAVPPQDWGALPAFPMPRASLGGEVSAFVKGEVEAGRCRRPVGTTGVEQPVALLVGDDGRVVRVVPRAIDCPTVEQFTVGYLLALTRSGPGSAAPPAPGWYRLTVSFTW